MIGTIKVILNEINNNQYLKADSILAYISLAAIKIQLKLMKQLLTYSLITMKAMDTKWFWYLFGTIPPFQSF